jgi:hypothetical protein
MKAIEQSYHDIRHIAKKREHKMEKKGEKEMEKGSQEIY